VVGSQVLPSRLGYVWKSLQRFIAALRGILHDFRVDWVCWGRIGEKFVRSCRSSVKLKDVRYSLRRFDWGFMFGVLVLV
jgi:hypothetical protein